MANPDIQGGFIPIRHLNGNPYNGAANRYVMLAATGTNAFIGDLVVFGGEGDAAGVPDVAVASAGGDVLGAIVGIEPKVDEPKDYRTASTLRYVYVADDPDLIFRARADAGAVLTLSDIGTNTEIVTTHAGSTTTGKSGMEINSTPTGTGAAQIRILRLLEDAENDISAANALWEVMINEHSLKSTTGV